MFIEAPGEGDSSCKSEGPNCELIERTYHYVIASHSFQMVIKNMEVVEDFESRPHNAVSFLVERKDEFQVWREQKMPKASPGHSGWKLPGRSKVKEGRAEEEEEEDNHKMENEVINVILAREPRETDAAEGGARKATFAD